MQKKLIALAVAGLISAPVFAQSNVQVYGILDMSVGATKTDGGKNVTRVDDNLWSSSRLGFRGTEDLGNGLKGIFQLEMGTLDLDTGGSVALGRDTFVGLAGNFGTLRLGRFLTPVGAWGGNFEATGGSNAFRVDHVFTGSLRAAFDVRVNNSVAYTSPTFSGVSVLLHAAPDENGAVKNDIYAGGLSYANGPLKAAYAYHEQRNVAEYHFLGAAYDFGVVALFAQGGIGELDGGASADDEEQWSVGVAAPVGAAGKVSLAYGEMDNVGGMSTSADAEVWSVTYMHNLSKRTAAYAGYSDLDTNAAANVGDKRVFGLGLRHVF